MPPPATMPSDDGGLRRRQRALGAPQALAAAPCRSAAPTLITASCEARRAIRSCMISTSRSCTARASSARICDSREATPSALPPPSTNVVESAVTITRRALPKCSRRTLASDSPASSAITVPPVNAARSPRCWMRRWPKPGARAATASIVRCWLLATSMPSARAVDVLGQDHERPRVLHHRVERRQQVVGVLDRLVGHEDVRVLEDRLHPLGVAHHVGRHPAVLDDHALDELDRDARACRTPRSSRRPRCRRGRAPRPPPRR